MFTVDIGWASHKFVVYSKDWTTVVYNMWLCKLLSCCTNLASCNSLAIQMSHLSKGWGLQTKFRWALTHSTWYKWRNWIFWLLYPVWNNYQINVIPNLIGYIAGLNTHEVRCLGCSYMYVYLTCSCMHVSHVLMFSTKCSQSGHLYYPRCGTYIHMYMYTYIVYIPIETIYPSEHLHR